MYKKAHEKIRENPGLPRSDLERGYHRPPRAAPKAAAKGEEKGPSFNPKKLTGKDKKLNAMRKLVGGVVTAE